MGSPPAFARVGQPGGDALRVPPHSVEAEQSVIGAMLIDARAADAVAGLLGPADFYLAEHRLIWRACMDLLAASRPIDVITVHDRLQELGKQFDAGGLAYLNDMAQGVPGVGNVAAYAAIVRERAVCRAVMAVALDLGDAARAAGGSGGAVSAVIDVAVSALMALQQGSHKADEPVRIGDMLPAWIDDLNSRAEGKTDAISMGLADVDRVLAGGPSPGDLVVVASRPSMGKSAFTLGIMRAASAHGPVLACSMEDSARMLVSRHVASVGRANLADIRRPDRAPATLWEKVSDAVEQLQGLPIWIDDRAGLSLQAVRNKAQFVRAKNGGKLAMVVVDYLQLMEDEGETRAQELSRICRGLKRMAKDLRCAVVLVCQLSREADKVSGPPRLDHLAELGGIEQAADIIGLLWREHRSKPRPDNEYIGQIEFAKNKNGATATVHLAWHGATQRWDNLDTTGYEH